MSLDLGERFQRVALVLHSEEAPAVRETYGFTGSQGVVLEGQLLRPANAEPEGQTVFVFMHPTSTLNLLPMPTALAERGHHVLCASSRYPKNDSALIMEKVVLDLAAWVRWAREEAGYAKVVLVGWSGGGSLSLLYQSQAESPSITHTPAGDPVDVVGADIPSRRRGGLHRCAPVPRRDAHRVDGPVGPPGDTTRPSRRDLDIYGRCAAQPPFAPAFVAAFREAQRERNRRISSWALDELARLRDAEGPEQERPFIVHRTMCDVRWIDPTVDPNDRQPDHCYLGDPRTANVGPVGLARYTTLRSWLSQWSMSTRRRTAPRTPPGSRRRRCSRSRTAPTTPYPPRTTPPSAPPSAPTTRAITSSRARPTTTSASPTISTSACARSRSGAARSHPPAMCSDRLRPPLGQHGPESPKEPTLPRTSTGDTSQTLGRGLDVLELVAGSPDGLTPAQVAAELELSRTIVYRLIGTLVDHRLLRRGPDGVLTAGLGTLRLTQNIAPTLRDGARDVLEKLAEDLGATAHLVIAEGEEALAVSVVEPRHTTFHVAYRTGSRTPLGTGALGEALLASRRGEPASSSPPASSSRARRASSPPSPACPASPPASASSPSPRPTRPPGRNECSRPRTS